jgi:thymidylate synthase ThyX
VKVHPIVELISYTPDALELLLLTKETRLQGEDSTIEAIKAWPEAKKLEHLAYMKDTIKSSWEFVDFVFRISNVTRNFTHQFVRTRPNSYAQESQRVVDISDHQWLTPECLDDIQQNMYNNSVSNTLHTYTALTLDGVAAGDARGVVPSSVLTSITVKTNLRTMAGTAETRLCFRTQGEYQEVFKQMKAAAVEVYPWVEDFLNVACANNGICIFPRYEQCPIQKFCHNAPDWRKEHNLVCSTIKAEHAKTTHEAKPVIFKSMTKELEK